MYDYNFPFPPYAIQLEFMNELFNVLHESKHGIFESPTGTGKSLSIICSTMHWLQQHQNNRIEEIQIKIDQLKSSNGCDVDNKQPSSITENEDEPDWMRDFETTEAVRREIVELNHELECINAYLERMESYKKELDCSKTDNQAPFKKHKSSDDELVSHTEKCEDDGLTEDDLVVDDYSSDTETTALKKNNSDLLSDANEVEVDCDKRPLPQILFCSRTHSQLSQFIKELNKSVYGRQVSAVGMGSRSNMCINKSVLKLKHNNAINEACLDLINKNKIKSVHNSKEQGSCENEMPVKKRKTNHASTKCPFYSSSKINKLREIIVTEASDIEDVVTHGQQLQACPYYATRFAAQSMHVLALPYQALLHRSTRESLGISLKNNVVIIDEAHNLLESLASVQNIELSGNDFYQLYHQLQAYMYKYKSKLKSKNLVYIRQILLVLSQCLRFLGGKIKEKPCDTKITNGVRNVNCIETVNSFSYKSEFDHVNLYKLLVYFEKSQICRKLSGFAQRYSPSEISDMEKTSEVEKENCTPVTIEGFIRSINSKHDKVASHVLGESTESQKMSTSVSQDAVSTPTAQTEKTSNCKIYQFKSFLEVLICDASLNCKILVKKGDNVGNSSVKTFILNPAQMFSDVITQCRSVILAGGTMQPFEEFTNQLFSALGVPENKVHVFTCGHIVDKSQIKTLIVENGPTGRELQFSFKDRQNEDVFVELGRLLCNVIPRVPGGCVVFFPSYDFEHQVVSVLLKHKMMEIITSRKPLFKESRSSGANSEVVFAKYKKQIDTNPKTGALLLAVMGGKMSEGINFSDNYGRCVIVVGMPYPNTKSLELNAKIDFLNQLKPGLGQSHYENLCIKSVNQSIGRAIRHKNDYACVLLLDKRFARENTRMKLPAWMKESTYAVSNFGTLISNLNSFYRTKSLI